MNAAEHGGWEQLLLLGIVVGVASTSCNPERCLASDHVVPGSAKVELVDESTGDVICEDIAEDSNQVIFHEDVCQFWIPRWFESAETGPPGFHLELDNYVDQSIEFETRTNSCGEVQKPPFRSIVVVPGDDPVPGEDGGAEPELEPEPEPEDAGDGPPDAAVDAADASSEADGGAMAEAGGDGRAAGSDGAADSGSDDRDAAEDDASLPDGGTIDASREAAQ